MTISGFTNTSTAGTSTSAIATVDAGTTVDSGTTNNVTLSATALSSPTWAASTTTLGATGASYTYSFKTPTLSVASTSITMTIPPGTSGTPTVGTVSGVTATSVSRSGTTLTVAIASLLLSGASISIQVKGLTNTTTVGAYASNIVLVSTLGASQASATAPAVTFNGTLTLTSPASLSWAGTLTGSNLSAVANSAASEQLGVSDTTATGNGWHITASATTLTSGLHSLPNTGTLLYTGSVTSPTSTAAPTATCTGTCTVPSGGGTSYPVALTTAVSTPSSYTIYDDGASFGLGGIQIGGSSAANPIGWWVRVPGSAFAGTYTSTVTLTVVSGP